MFAETTVERGGHVKHGTDDAAWVRYYKRSEKGVSKDFIEIRFPGDNKTVVNRQVKEDDKHRWPKQWDAYQRGEEFKSEGYPLEQWPEVDEGQVREFNYKNIYTVEQLALMTDSNLQSLGPGGRELQAKAKAFVDVIKKTADASKYAAQYEAVKADNDRLAEENRLLSGRLQALEDMMSSLKPSGPQGMQDIDAPRRGRPSKSE